MPKPACVPCQRFFRPKRNGQRVLEGMPVGQDVPPGTADPDRWHPYKLWVADLWECEGCGAQIVSGYGREPQAERHHDGFDHLLEVYALTLVRVNDC